MKTINSIIRKLLLVVLIAPASERALGQITFAQPIYLNLKGMTDQIASGDFNGDKLTDIVAVNNDSVLIFSQNSAGALNVKPLKFYLKKTPQTMTVGDVNNDGYDDIITGLNDTIYVYYQNRKSNKNLFTKISYGTTGTDIDAIKCGDANNDGYNDIAISFWNSERIAILFGNHKSEKLDLRYYQSTSSGYDHIDISKIDKDTKNSVFKTCGQKFGPVIQYKINIDKTLEGGDPILILRTTGDNFAGFCTANTYSINERYAFASHANNRPDARVFVLRSGFLKSDTIIKNMWDVPQTLRSGDLNNDGKEEVIVIHGGWNMVSVISSDSLQQFIVGCPNNASVDALTIADVNNDKRLDIITANTYSGITVLLNTTKK